jgi:chromosome segregation ATPase
VTFEEWLENPAVTQLWQTLSESADHSVRIVHDLNYNKYWIVGEHNAKPSTDPHFVSDTQHVEELQEMVRSMASQIRQLQFALDKANKKAVTADYERIRHAFRIADLEDELLEKEEEMERREGEMERKDRECAELRDTLYENQSILDYVELQAKEMREMLQINYEPNTNTKKMTLEELID